MGVLRRVNLSSPEGDGPKDRPQLEIRLLGRFSVRRGAEEIPGRAFGGRLAATLVRILITRRGSFISRDALVEALWPQRPPADTATNLRVLVKRARRALGDPALIITGPGGYSFTEDERCLVDAEAFLARVKAGRERLAGGQAREALHDLRAALEHWGGEPLAEDAYEDWAEQYRTSLARAHQEALEGGAAAALTLLDPAQAASLAELAVAREPLREAAQLLYVRSLAVCGDPAAALAAFDRFRQTLAAELGLDPSPEAFEMQGRILRGEPLGPPVRRPTPALAPPPFQDLAFVGREEELGRILTAATASASPPSVVLVSGPAGTGKSRLLTELAARSPMPVLAARANLAEREQAWGLARSLLQEALGFDPAGAGAIPDRAARALADVVPELEELRPIGAGPLDPQSRLALAQAGGLRLLERVSARGALVVIDDLQWADATSLKLLGQAMERLPGVGWVLAYRSEEIPRQGPVALFLADLHRAAGEVAEIRLGPLPIDAVSQLVADEQLIRVISEETDRTPLAVAEVLRGLAALRAIEGDARGRWRSRMEGVEDLARQAARQGQQRAVKARAQRQSPRRREILCLLALLGREAPSRLVAAAAGTDPATVLDDLDALARAGLVRSGDRGWATAHDTIAETLAAGLNPPERTRLHEMLAAALLGQGADPAELARHLAGAGDAGAAAEAFARAARQHLDSNGDEEAERLADAGLGLDPNLTQRASLLEVRAEARARKGRFAEARDDLRAALWPERPGPERARILARIAMLTSGPEDYLQAAELVELALTEAGTDPGARAAALGVGAMVDVNTNRLARAESRLAEALALFTEAGDADGIARALEGQAMITFSQGRFREAVPALDEAARLLRDSGKLALVGSPLVFRGIGLVLMDRAEEGLENIEEALDLERMLDRPEAIAWCLGNRAYALAALGRAEAMESAEACLAIARRLAHREFTAGGLLAVGLACEVVGDLDRAEASLRESIEIDRNMPIWSSLAAARLARLLIARGDLVSAESYVAQAEAGGIPAVQYEARLARAELAAARGDPDASAIAAQALALAEAQGHLMSAARLKELV